MKRERKLASALLTLILLLALPLLLAGRAQAAPSDGTVRECYISGGGAATVTAASTGSGERLRGRRRGPQRRHAGELLPQRRQRHGERHVLRRLRRRRRGLQRRTGVQLLSLDAAAFLEPESFSGWDFPHVWAMGAERPLLKELRYTVRLTNGGNMTTAGAETQTFGSPAAIGAVSLTYTAADGYYFPTDYASVTVNGVTAERVDYTTVSVSGTPADSVLLTLTGATAKTQEATPAAAFTASGADCGAPAPVPVIDDYGGYAEPSFVQELPAVLTFDGGTVAVSPTHAVEGERVTLTARAEAGWHLVSLTVTRGSFNVPLSGGGNIRTFFMPGGSVEIKATFARDAAQPVKPAPAVMLPVVLSPQRITVNGAEATVEAYNIGGTNFFGLRELAAIFGYSVDYDPATNTAIVESR